MLANQVHQTQSYLLTKLQGCAAQASKSNDGLRFCGLCLWAAFLAGFLL